MTWFAIETRGAVLFGAAIIWIFAWDQFKRPSYAASKDLTRLLELLAPNDMRRTGAYLRAYVAYALVLSLIYFTLCLYTAISPSGVVVLRALGLDIPASEGEAEPSAQAPDQPSGVTTGYVLGYDPDRSAPPPEPKKEVTDIGPGPTLPLLISLMMVGLAPAIPPLQRLEEKIRFAAHRLSGIPTRLLVGSRHLRETPLELTRGADTYLIAERDWQRLATYTTAVANRDGSENFTGDILKILALRAWVLRDALPDFTGAARERFDRIEGPVRDRVQRLIADLDRLSGFDQAVTPAAATEEKTKTAWEAAILETERVCDDVCVLLMVYVERGVFEPDQVAATEGHRASVTERETQHQAEMARAALSTLVASATNSADRDDLAFALFARAAMTALVVAAVFGLAIGADSVEGVARDPLKLGLTFALWALLTYVLSLLIAISFQQNRLEIRSQRDRWRNVFTDPWSAWLPQRLVVFLLAALAAVACHTAYNVYWTARAVEGGWPIILDNLTAVLWGAISYVAPGALLGPILALFVITMVDARRASRWRSLLWMPAVAAVVMAVWAIAARAFGSWTAFKASLERNPGLAETWHLDWSLLAQAGFQAGLIGLAVCVAVYTTLRNEFPSFGRMRGAASVGKDA